MGSLKWKNCSKGITLIELAIVLVILGVLLGMTLPLLSELSKHRHYKSTQKQMEEIREALVGYAVIHGRLPQADTNGDGQGDPGQTTGFLPFLDLGLGATDAWRKPYRYDVNSKLIGTSSLQSLCAAISQIGATEYPQLAFSAGGTASAQTAVVVSGGENCAFDGENGDGDRNYEALPQSENYDDLVVWISPSTLAGRLNCAGSGGGGPCNSYTVTNLRNIDIYVIGGVYGTCTQVQGNGVGSFSIGTGHSVSVYVNQIQCQNNTNPSVVTFSQASAQDADGDCMLSWTNTGLSDY